MSRGAGTSAGPAGARRFAGPIARALSGVALGGALVVGLVAPERGDAHHAWTEIDTGRTVTLTGTVRSLKWENPHASLVLETVDHGTRVDWTVAMSGIARMEARGLEAATLATGRALTIVASPARDERHVVRANRIEADGKEYVLY